MAAALLGASTKQKIVPVQIAAMRARYHLRGQALDVAVHIHVQRHPSDSSVR